MCGILGFINHEHVMDLHRTDWVKQALLVDQLRGIDSTGLAVVPPAKSTAALPPIRVYKKAMAAADFLQLNSTKTLLGDVNLSQFVLGHNRWATVGDSSNDNYAHPFSFKDVTLVHNGTLLSRQGLRTEHTVDSAAIAIEMGNTKPKDYANILKELDGAYTLVWYNSENKHVYMARNEERPMFLAKAFKNKTLFFASEDWMIQDILARINNSILDLTKDNMYDLWSMETETLYDFDLSAENLSWKETKYEGYRYVPPAYESYNQGMSTYGHNTIPYNFQNKEKVKLTAKGCPVVMNSFLYADAFTYTPLQGGSNKGTLSGKSADYPDVKFVVPNFPLVVYQEFSREWSECRKWVEEDETKGIFPKSEALFSGKITCITKRSKKKGWIVNLGLKSCTIDLVDTIIPAPEVTPEKKFLPALTPDTNSKSQEKTATSTNSRMLWLAAAMSVVFGLVFWTT